MSIRVSILTVKGGVEWSTAQMINPSFDVTENPATGWTASGGGLIKSDTIYDSPPNRGLWTVVNIGDVLTGLFNGSFRAGIKHTLRFKVNAGPVSAVTQAYFGVSGGDETNITIPPPPGIGDAYLPCEIEWTPIADTSAATFRMVAPIVVSYGVDTFVMTQSNPIVVPQVVGAYDVTDRVDGLGWSNVNPGGHEKASFMLKGDWTNGFPEVKRGNIVLVEDGGQELFTGRIDDQDPQVGADSRISVTAYGLGVRLKDDTMREIYIDRDLTKWKGPSVQRRINLIATWGVQDPSITPDASTGQPSLDTSVRGSWMASTKPMQEPTYDAQGIPLDSIYYAWKKNVQINDTDTNWDWEAYLIHNDVFSSFDATGNLRAAGPGTGTLTATNATKIFAGLTLSYAVGPSAGDNIEYGLYWTVLAVYGRHGLTKQGIEDAVTAKGFFASQIVTDMCNRLALRGIKARRIDTTSLVLQQLAFLEDISHEGVLAEVTKYHSVDWGVWGPSSLLGEHDDDPAVGYLDWIAKHPTSRDWIAWRSECENCDLHTEIGSTYNVVVVRYTDASGASKQTRRTVISDALVDAGIPQRATSIDGGSLTTAGAEQLGDAFLALNSGQPVARGRVEMVGPARHNVRGLTPPHFMRADGSNLVIPDAFPDKDILGFQTSADRRTTFPIKRVDVDAGGEVPRVTVELDQANDLLSILTARLQLNAQLTIGSG